VISRQWRGVAKAEQADAYIEHLRDETFPAIRGLAGFVSASILRRAVPEGVEFVVVTEWTSLDSIRAFAGDDVELAVVPPKVRDMMLDYDRRVRHYDVAT
jgi:heme-degrading monooxygenase HmoA